MSNRDLIYDLFKGIGEGIAYFDVISERSFRGCLRIPASAYPDKYVPDPDKQYARGSVVIMPGDNVSKYVAINDNVRIPNDKPPGHPDNRDFRLVRNLVGRYRHVREEFCEQGMWRWWDEDQNRPQDHGWYELTALIYDGSQPLYQIPNIWTFRGSENPPE